MSTPAQDGALQVETESEHGAPAARPMIHCRLLELMGREGIRFVARLSEETGINRRTLTLLLENRMLRFDADVLARLCAFFDCQPGDLLTFVPDSEAATGSGRRPARRNDHREIPLS